MIKFFPLGLQFKSNIGVYYRHIIAFLMLAISLLLIYSNSFQASWHFDDYENIESNPRVQITNINLVTLVQTFYASPEGKRNPYRSVSYLSFALNAFFGGKDVFGYHVVNICIHIITAFLLFITVLKLYETPNLSQQSKKDSFVIALMTASFWAFNPIQTQAVTYIVQRMAAMATMFYLAGIYCYITARLEEKSKLKVLYYLGCVCSYFLAVMSKENAILMPLALLFVEFIFFRDCRNTREIKLLFLLIVIGTVFVIALGAAFFGNPFVFLNGYPNRTFTPIERLMTETRVLVYYLSQIFYPIPTRLSLYHDIMVSKSLFHPWTTLPSILLILSLIGLGLKWIGSRPLLSFAILFFFINHLIESTLIGLELFFEHRNYLPSLFLFMPISAGIHQLIRNYNQSNTVMRQILVAAVIMILAGFGAGTYIRNQAWANEKTLWEDTLSKAPNSIRAHHELAFQYYEKIGNYDAALFLYHRGLNLNGQNIYEKTLSLNNIASIHFTRGEYDKAVTYWKEALNSYPKYKQGYYRLALAQTRLGEWDDAFKTLNHFTDQELLDPKSHRLKGIILLHKNKPANAAGCFRKSIKKDPHDWQSLLYLGVAFSMTEQHDKAYHFYQMAESEKPKEAVIQLLLAANRLALGDDINFQIYIDKFIDQVGSKSIDNYLKRLFKNHNPIISPLAEIRPLLSEKTNYTQN